MDAGERRVAARRRAAVALVALGLAAAFAAIVASGARLVTDPEDFRAFYCAAKVASLHLDPYLAEPLRTCENAEIAAIGARPWPGLVLPAPLPPYDFLAYGLLAKLSFAAASSIDTLLTFVAMLVSALLIARVAKISPVATIAALFLTVGLVDALNGRSFPFALVALCAAAYELTRGRDRSAAVFVLLAMSEPHVALPALVALGCARPRTRPTLAIGAAVLIAASVLAVGAPASVEYLRAVLPAHALAEASSNDQHSLTTVLSSFGVPAQNAVAIADVQYLLTSLLGIGVALRLSRRREAPELLALLPAAFATFGGPFIHSTQMIVAVPALFALAHRFPEHRRAFAAAVIAAAIPWRDVVEDPPFVALALPTVLAALVAASLPRPSKRFAVAVAASVAAFACVAVALQLNDPAAHPNIGRAFAAAPDPHALAEASWGRFVALFYGGDALRTYVLRLPLWTALGVTLALSTAQALRKTVPDPATRSPAPLAPAPSGALR